MKDACVVRRRDVGKVLSLSATRWHPILRQLGIIARNRKRTGIIATEEQDNAALWHQIANHDEDFSHQISARIVQFAKQHGASILVFEHLGNLKPEQGKYSRRGNSKRAFWMKGRIFRYCKYKAWNEGIITSRVNPRTTSRECACCHANVIRSAQGTPQQGYTMGAPLVICPACGMRGNADRNASIVIGQRLVSRYQEKPRTPLARQTEDPRGSGVVICQDAKEDGEPSLPPTGQADRQGHGTAHGKKRRMGAPSPRIATQLRLFTE
ncbi:hypothetical protein KTT_52590 [Tengunoibacter tsumagoiensis]|uniref:Cas12f1-like TNB domain-containing protein n=1 Tax=Tengunoibacter tsumagoiensis TaxID=2014871 RepID=A0A402A8B5_9CHLR|nr:hypothetical protein KTT_52590 [Tengunoibacter tsumagoiensis]